MKLKAFLIFALFLGLSFGATAQHGKAHGHKHPKSQQKHSHKIAKKEKEYFKKLRKNHLKHLEHCHSCNHAFYHNNDYYYRDEVYYSRSSLSPIWFDVELFFRNGPIRVTL